jgi:hypothetical protein
MKQVILLYFIIIIYYYFLLYLLYYIMFYYTPKEIKHARTVMTLHALGHLSWV